MDLFRICFSAALVVSACTLHAANTENSSAASSESALTIRDGIVFLPRGSLSAEDEAKAVKVLLTLPGVRSVRIVSPGEGTATEPVKAAGGTAQNPDKPLPVVTAEATTAPGTALLPTGFAPKGHLFKPLLADPRWAHFSSTYRNYRSNNFDGRHIGNVSFGETIALYRNTFGNSGVQGEAGIQGSVFSDFNLGASSADLINTDFIGALYYSLRAGRLSSFARIYHQSSHLGDEFLLRKVNTTFERVNLSYEGLDLRLSYEFPYGVRIYGGSGGLFHREPRQLKPWQVQYGAEFRSPWRSGLVRPIMAVDFKNHQENRWSTDISARAGLEFDNLQVLGRNLQFLLEYFNGFTPSGQFYKTKVEYLGVGLHYHF